MNATLRVLASRRRQTFFSLVRQTATMTADQLVEVIQSPNRFGPVTRVAALRNLVAQAPIEVTRGSCYLARRMLVRSHYGV